MRPSQFVRALLLGSIAAGGAYTYTLFSSDMPQQGPLGVAPVRACDWGFSPMHARAIWPDSHAWHAARAARQEGL